MDSFKICSGCKLKKPLSEFNKHKDLSYGRQNYCKECNKVRACQKLDSYYKGNYIYMFLENFKILYVGSTTNIYERMTEHIHVDKLKQYPNINGVILYKVDNSLNSDCLRFLEQEFIYILNPLLNQEVEKVLKINRFIIIEKKKKKHQRYKFLKSITKVFNELNFYKK
ncbi:MAG: GIY-YIG nuclease family protein [Clostridium perfringens]|nr:GIY-YIG nuclease family protein [Clostridium perfringens]